MALDLVLQPLPSERMAAHEVSTLVNSSDNDSAACILRLLHPASQALLRHQTYVCIDHSHLAGFSLWVISSLRSFCAPSSDIASTSKQVIEFMGGRSIVFSTDYPHGDSRYTEAVDHFLRLPISEDDKRKILWDNCAAYYAM